jgi:ATP synthase protein I
MTEPDDRRQPGERPDARRSLERDVGRFRRRESGSSSFWRSLSVLGTIGWSISLPSVGGAWLGHRLDVWLDAGVHFTLILLFVGVLFGSVVAARILREHRS